MKNLGTLILGIILGALLMYFYFNMSNKGDGTTAIIKPKGVITPTEAKVLDTTFNLRHKLISDSIVIRPDNRSSWWSLDDITNYLEYSKHKADSLGYAMSGVRVYLGAYPEENGQVGYTTMFMVPTGSETQVNEGFKFEAINNEDLTGIGPLNMGTGGNPPNSNYPQ